MTADLINIRSALLADAEALARTHEESWRSTYQGIIPHLALSCSIARHGPRRWERAIFTNAPILLVDYDGEAVAYATYGRGRMRGTPYQGEIFELYVRPDYQGVGFGSKLFRAARERLARRHLAGLVVWALADNDMACEFYLHLGGRPISEGAERFGDVVLRKVAFAWR